jgi:hypothetical protein
LCDRTYGISSRRARWSVGFTMWLARSVPSEHHQHSRPTRGDSIS